MLALVWFSFDMASESFESRETSFSAWNPPIWPAKGAIFVASVLMLLQGIVRLLEDIAIAFNLSYYDPARSEEHTSELQSRPHLVCRLLLEKKKQNKSHLNVPN